MSNDPDDDVEQAEEDGGNLYETLVDDYGWTTDEVVDRFDLDDPYSGAEQNDDQDGTDFLNDSDWER